MIVWSPEMDATLRTMRAAGCGYERCGERIGVANSAVRARVIRLGLPTWGHDGPNGSGETWQSRRAAFAERTAA